MQTDTKHQVYAGFFVRLAAFLVDMIIVNAGLVAVRLPMWIVSMKSPNNILVRDFIFQYSVVDIVIYLLTALYFVLLTYYTGSTLGKKLFQLRVISTENRKLTLFEVAYRETIGRFLSGIVMQLGYLLIIAEKQHRGVHDLLSDTCVIYYHEKKVYVHTQMNYRNMAPNPGYTVPTQGGGNMQGNGSVPPYMQRNENAPGNMPPGMQRSENAPGNMPPGMQGNESVPPSFPNNGSVSPGYFSAPVKEPSLEQEEDTASPDFVRQGEETPKPEVPFERNE